MNAFKTILGAILMTSTLALAEDSFPDRNEKVLTVKQAACVKKATSIAKAIGIEKDSPADIIKSVEVYSDAAGDYEKQELHIWTGDAELVVRMLPNFYDDGKCQYSDSYIHRD